MVAGTCTFSYLGGWGRKITWTWEAGVAVSWDCVAALQPGDRVRLHLKKKEWFQSYFLFSFFWDGVSLLSLRLKCKGAVLAHCNLHLLGSSNSRVSAPQVAGITVTHHHTWLILFCFSRDGVLLFDQAGLKLLISGDLPTLASQNAGITGMNHCTWPLLSFLKEFYHLTWKLFGGPIRIEHRDYLI